VSGIYRHLRRHHRWRNRKRYLNCVGHSAAARARDQHRVFPGNGVWIGRECERAIVAGRDTRRTECGCHVGRQAGNTEGDRLCGPIHNRAGHVRSYAASRRDRQAAGSGRQRKVRFRLRQFNALIALARVEADSRLRLERRWGH